MKPLIMNPMTSLLSLYISFLSLLLVDAHPAKFYDWTVSFSPRAPLGVDKQVILINGQFPGPLLNLTTNDVVNVNIHNNLTEPFLMTWNGVQMRKNSWQDGAQETNCPIQPGKNWTYSFQVKDQIGSFFYFPTLHLQKAAGGYGAIRVNNRDVVPLPFQYPYQEFDVLIGDWYNADHRDLRAILDDGGRLPLSDGILINGFGPNEAIFEFEPGMTYRLRISNVGLKESLNFRIQDHLLYLVETEGSYTVKQHYHSLDIHAGQSYSVLVRAKNSSDGKSFYMVASSRFTLPELFGIATIRYPDSAADPSGPLPSGPAPFDYRFSMDQARSIKWDLSVGAARPNPQGSYHYGNITISRSLVLENGVMMEKNKVYYTINAVSFVHPSTPLKLADYFQIDDVFQLGVIPETPSADNTPTLGTSVVAATYHDFYHLVFQNKLPSLQTYHLDGYNFWVVGMERGTWNKAKMESYNLVDAVSRSTVQVYPFSWTAILVSLDNQGMWNLRSQDAEKWYRGQELYIRVKGIGEEDPSKISIRDELPIPANTILCGRVAGP